MPKSNNFSIWAFKEFGILRMIKCWQACTLGALICMGLTGCKQEKPLNTASTRLQVVSTIFPLADWAQQVGGKHVQVTTLLRAGSSPHTFEPTPKEMREVRAAKILIKAGLKMDDWGGALAD